MLMTISEQIQWTESSVLKEAAIEDKKERNLSMFTVHHKHVCDDSNPSESLTEKRHIVSGLPALTRNMYLCTEIK